MNFNFNKELAENYKANSQKIRVMSEDWVVENAYCVKCGNKLSHFENNKPVGDMYCSKCREEFEVKSNKNELGKKIFGSGYNAMIEKIEQGTIPNFFYLNYSKENLEVKNLLIIPKHFFTKSIVQARPPLKPTAKRAGWIGCNIDVSSIPEKGKIYIVKNGIECDKKEVLRAFNSMIFVQNYKIEPRGWILDIIKCIEMLDKKEFTLDDMYAFEAVLKLKHPNNNNVRAKIRQMLQILRNDNYLEFHQRGMYRILD